MSCGTFSIRGEAFGKSKPSEAEIESSWDLGAQIFSTADLAYISQQAPQMRTTFRRERRGLALLWIQSIRRSARAILRNHSVAARVNAGVNPVRELRLAVDYLLLIVLCFSIQAVIQVGGPFAARKLILLLMSSGERLLPFKHAFASARVPSPGSVTG